MRVRGPAPGHEWIGSFGGTPLYDAEGRLLCALVTLRDVTAQHQAEAALREADRRKDTFLATLAHELRNPLAPIGSGLEILKIQVGEDVLQPALGIIERQLGHLVRLVDDLLDVSRISRGKISLRRERVALREVIEQALESSRPLLQGAGHEVAVSFPDDPMQVDGDRVRLAQIFLNLLNNAAKYTRAGGHIQVTAQRDGAEAVVTVSDTGIGIAREHLPHLFEMFSQVSAASGASQDGLGIGLSLARGLVELHGGRIWAESDGPGRGSAFIVRLPLAAAAAASAAPAGPGADPGAARRILVVDDNRDAACALELFLRLCGHQTEVAHDGIEAVEAAERFRPQVVLLDIGMPRLDGFGACRRLRAEPWGRDVTIIAITGWGQEDDRRRTREAGFDAHLVKPVDTSTLTMLLSGLAPRPR